MAPSSRILLELVFQTALVPFFPISMEPVFPNLLQACLIAHPMEPAFPTALHLRVCLTVHIIGNQRFVFPSVRVLPVQASAKLVPVCPTCKKQNVISMIQKLLITTRNNSFSILSYPIKMKCI